MQLVVRHGDGIEIRPCQLVFKDPWETISGKDVTLLEASC